MALEINRQRVSTPNITINPLASGATFTGAGDRDDYPEYSLSILTDQIGKAYVEFRNDGSSNWTRFPTEGYDLRPNQHEFHTAVKSGREIRVIVENTSDEDQTFLEVFLYSGTFGRPAVTVRQTLSSDSDATLVRMPSIDEVMKGRHSDELLFHIYGRNADVDTTSAPEDIWNGGGQYTGFPLTTAENLMVVSDDANDTLVGTGARVVVVYYLDENKEMFDESGNQLSMTVNLNGTTPVDTGIPVTRVWRAIVVSSGSNGKNLGTISFYWKDTPAVVFARMPVGFGVTQLSNFTIPVGYRGYLTRWSMDLLDANANRAEVALKLQFNGGNTILTRPTTISNTKGFERLYYGGIDLGTGTDIIVTCLSVTSNDALITSDYDLHLVKE